jgi:hypothetical protein
MPAVSTRAVVASLAVLALISSSVVAQATAAGPSGVEADAGLQIRIDGGSGGAPGSGRPGGLAGISVEGAGDVNGDGRPDVVIGAPLEDNNGRPDSGSAYVVFGRSEPATIDLSNLGGQGFRIDGATSGELAGRSVSGAGDVNGDRRPDLLIGAPGAFAPSQEEPRKPRGRVYVVFGKTGTDPIDLSRLETGGYAITGRRLRFPDAFGFDVSGAGDVNRDGRADAIVTAPGNPGFEDRLTPASAYVVYGKSSPAAEIRIDRLGRRGFRVAGLGGIELSVAGVGDVNRDRRADVVIGAGSARARGQTRGAAYVIFGARQRRTVNVTRPGRWGFRVEGANRGDSTGASVAGAGDVNRDRLSDIVIGAPGFLGSGAAFVVFGKRSSSTVSLVTRGRPGLRRLGRRGFRITGERGMFAANQVTGLQDVNADRRPDVGLTAGGSVYVVFGKSSGAEVRLSALDGRGFAIEGTTASPGGNSGLPGPARFDTVAAAGDMNGDGRGEILVGSPDASNNGRARSGSVYVFFSR